MFVMLIKLLPPPSRLYVGSLWGPSVGRTEVNVLKLILSEASKTSGGTAERFFCLTGRMQHNSGPTVMEIRPFDKEKIVNVSHTSFVHTWTVHRPLVNSEPRMADS